MEGLAVLLVIIIWVTCWIIYVTTLKSTLSRSKENGIAIFGQSYGSLSSMGSDLSFLSKLWSGERIEEHADQMLIDSLLRARKLLRFEMALSIGIFLLLMFFAGMSA